MPLLRYFLFAGTGLLLLLFAVSAWLPVSVPVEREASAVDKTTIRINGGKPIGERVTIDTSVPTTPAPVVASSDAAPPAEDAQNSVREAFAKMEDAPSPAAMPPAPQKKVAVRKHPKRAAVATARPFGGFFDLW